MWGLLNVSQAPACMAGSCFCFIQSFVENADMRKLINLKAKERKDFLVNWSFRLQQSQHDHSGIWPCSKHSRHDLRGSRWAEKGGIIPKAPCLTLSNTGNWPRSTYRCSGCCCCRCRCRCRGSDRDRTIAWWTCTIASYGTLIILSKSQSPKTSIYTVWVPSDIPIDVPTMKYHLRDLVGLEGWDRWRFVYSGNQFSEIIA